MRDSMYQEFSYFFLKVMSCKSIYQVTHFKPALKKPMSCGTQMFGINYSLLVHECHEKVFVVLREGVSGRRECHEKVCGTQCTRSSQHIFFEIDVLQKYLPADGLCSF